MFGLGGVYVEVLKDIAFRSFPLSREETLNMIGQINSYPLLLGVRGESRKDIDEVANTIIKVGWILQNCSAISDIEVNPLVVYDHGEGVKAVDVRILLRESEEA
jgi:acyl-CoA synthetase (NDP forming)